MKRLLLVACTLLALGCASRKPSIERDPGRYSPAETDSRKVTRLEERLHSMQDRVNAWIAELEAGRGRALDAAKLDAAIDRLRSHAKELERLRVSANDVSRRGAESEDLEREALTVEAAAERARADGLAALGRSEGTAAPPR